MLKVWPPLNLPFNEDLGTYRGVLVCACTCVVSLSCSPWKCCRWVLILGRHSASPPFSEFSLISYLPWHHQMLLSGVIWGESAGFCLDSAFYVTTVPVLLSQLSLFCLLPYSKDLLTSLGCYRLPCHSLVLTPEDYFLKSYYCHFSDVLGGRGDESLWLVQYVYLDISFDYLSQL